MLSELEEVRLRNGRCIGLVCAGRERPLASAPVSRSDLEEMVENASGQAVYAAQEMLKNGFLTVAGGHRLGLCGSAVYRDGRLYTIRELSSIDLRIARQIFGAAEPCVHFLWTHPRSTLILGAPASGKTTLLRDLIRQCSDRFGWRFGVVDERMELAACLNGMPQFDLGVHADVLSGVKKEQGIVMLLRSMNPQWIAVDEITAPEDVAAMIQASYCGVRFLATAHAASPDELKERPLYRMLMESGMFENQIVIGAGRKIQMHGREKLA